MSSEWSTHSIQMAADHVIKQFRSRSDNEHIREWRALRLLNQYSPDVAPAPLSADLAADPPVVIMSRLPGQPLRGGVVQPERVEAMARTLVSMFDSIPVPVASGLPCRLWSEGQVEEGIRSWAQALPADVPTAISGTVTEGLRWLDTAPLESCSHAAVPAVFGQADGNLANFLWDGDRVRLVDFEDSGRSDRAYELADVTEHVAAWVDTEFDASLFLDHFRLTEAEELRLGECRRLFALMWLLVLAREDPQHPRNPPGTAEQQAARLDALLS